MESRKQIAGRSSGDYKHAWAVQHQRSVKESTKKYRDTHKHVVALVNKRTRYVHKAAVAWVRKHKPDLYEQFKLEAKRLFLATYAYEDIEGCDGSDSTGLREVDGGKQEIKQRGRGKEAIHE